jgi:hypothetical protein
MTIDMINSCELKKKNQLYDLSSIQAK